MSESQWNKQGATLSHKNAGKEFALTEDEMFEAMKAGKLQYRMNYVHGNPYYRLLRAEVESLAKILHGNDGVQEHAEKHELRLINKEINSLKRKLVPLEKRKSEIIERQKQTKA